jgi:hypothetical protein
MNLRRIEFSTQYCITIFQRTAYYPAPPPPMETNFHNTLEAMRADLTYFFLYYVVT